GLASTNQSANKSGSCCGALAAIGTEREFVRAAATQVRSWGMNGRKFAALSCVPFRQYLTQSGCDADMQHACASLATFFVRCPAVLVAPHGIRGGAETTIEASALPSFADSDATAVRTYNQPCSSNRGPEPCLASSSKGFLSGQTLMERHPQPMQSL